MDTSAKSSLEKWDYLPIRHSRRRVQWGDGSTLFPLTFRQVTVQHTFLVVDTWALPYQMLNGTDFTDAHKVVFSSRPTSLTKNGQEVRVVRRYTKSVSIMATVGLS